MEIRLDFFFKMKPRQTINFVFKKNNKLNNKCKKASKHIISLLYTLINSGDAYIVKFWIIFVCLSINCLKIEDLNWTCVLCLIFLSFDFILIELQEQFLFVSILNLESYESLSSETRIGATDAKIETCIYKSYVG